MKGTNYDPQGPGGQPQQQPQGYPPYPAYPYYPYPGYPQQYPEQGPKKEDRALIWLVVILLIVFILIPIIIAGVLFFWVSSFSSSEDYMNESFVGALKQGDGNMTSGCLFEIYKLSGEPIRINNYRFKVSGVTGQPITLQWPDDGNTTAYTIDSGMGGSDSDCWNPVETIGFDAPPGLTGIEDGDKIEVLVLNREYGEVVFSDSFIYQD